MTDLDRQRLQQLLSSFDEASYVALANKGLVRRAQKDLESCQLSHEESDDAIVVRGDGWTVQMPASGPVDATDDTRASGVSRQILMATLYLQQHWATAAVAAPDVVQAPSTGVALREQLLSITPKQLERWAGKLALRKGAAWLASGETSISYDAGISISFVDHEVDARLLDGGSAGTASDMLDRVMTTSPKALHREWTVAAVLAVWRDSGRDPHALLHSEVESAEWPHAGMAASLQASIVAIEEMVAIGIAHPSTRSIERFFTLSVSARAAGLPRLSRLLRSIADQVTLVEARDARADASALLGALALAHTLASAIAKSPGAPATTLTGRARSAYDEVGELNLVGVGAYPWRTASGFEGLTVTLWDQASQEFFTWSESRPVDHTDSFSPAKSYASGAAWSRPVNKLCRSAFKLVGARWNDLGRLSASDHCSVPTCRDATWHDFDFGPQMIDRWTDLTSRIRAEFPMGLREAVGANRLVVLKPTKWGERFFNETRQCFIWRLHDSDDSVAQLSLPWRETDEAAITFLEAIKPEQEKLKAVVARIVVAGDGVMLEPVTLLSDGPHAVLNPAFDYPLVQKTKSKLLERLRLKYQRSNVLHTLAMETDQLSELSTLSGFPPMLRSLFADIGGSLLAIAETGTRSGNSIAASRLAKGAVALDRLGMPLLSERLKTTTSPSTRELLRAQYALQLHCQATHLSLATTSA